jgi:hypothetical protein
MVTQSAMRIVGNTAIMQAAQRQRSRGALSDRDLRVNARQDDDRRHHDGPAAARRSAPEPSGYDPLLQQPC